MNPQENISNEKDCIQTVIEFVKTSRSRNNSDEKIIKDLDRFDIPLDRTEDLFFALNSLGINMDNDYLSDEEDITNSDFEKEESYDDYDYKEDMLQSNVDYDKLFLKEIGRIPLLSHEEEIALSKKIQEGGPEGTAARKKMVEHNLKLVVSFARKYHADNMTLMDLIQEGSFGLQKAAEKYDHTKGYKFSTYASWWIRQAITRAISDQSRTIRLPVHMMETLNKLNRVKNKLSNELNREPSIEEISQAMDMPEAKIREAISYGIIPVSLETPIGEDGESNIADFVEDNRFESGQEKLEKSELSERIELMLDTLQARECDVLKMRFGIGYARPYTLEEIGQKYNVTRERIRQIEARALKRLKETGRTSILYGYTDDYDIKNPNE